MRYRLTITLLFFTTALSAQTASEPSDSLRQEMRSYVARNFSDIRTFNFSWQTSPSHTYHIERDGEQMERGKLHSQNAIHFNTTLPIVTSRRFSLYGVGQADFYNYKTRRVTRQRVFSQQEGENSQYYRLMLNGTYRTTLASKPFVVNASMGVDGYEHGIQQPLLMVAGVSVLKRDRYSSLSAGLSFLWPFTSIPVIPVVAYWHQLTPNWIVDVTLPRQVYMRYQFGGSHRLSAGCEMQSSQYYFRSQGDTRLFQETTLNAGLKYEYVAMRHFYFFLHGGLSSGISGGIYRPNRKEVSGGELVYTHKPKPFFEAGFSYNIYK